MEGISDEEQAMGIYALHIVLYTNDRALNAIKEIKPYIGTKDKESRKIFGALSKRLRIYDDNLYKRLGDNDVYFYADFNGTMDDHFDKDIEGLRRSAEWIFKCNGYEDTRYISKVETAFALVNLAISITNSYISGLKQNGARVFAIPEYKIDEIQKIMNNFYDWTMFMQHKDKVLDLSRYKSISKYFEKIKMSIVNRDYFEEAYAYALEEEKKRNNKE